MDDFYFSREEARRAVANQRLEKLKQLNNSEWLTTAEAAQYLRCSTDFIRDLCNDGTVPHVEVDRDYRIRRVDLDKLPKQIEQLPFLTVQQAALLLQVSKDAIYDLCKSGELRHQKIGSAIRIKRSDLEQLSVEDGW